MPNRVIRESVLDSDRYLAVPNEAERLLFLELLLLCDDFGLLPLNYGFLRRKTSLGAGRTEGQMQHMISVLADRDLVRVYRTDNGSQFGFIPRFGNSPRARKPKWPLPPNTPAFKEINDLAQLRNTSAPETETETETDKDSPTGESVGADVCPHKAIQRLYNDTLGEHLPKAKMWTPDRQRHAAARWKEIRDSKGWQKRSEGLAWFTRFFEAVKEDDFLMGRTGRGQGHEGWECTVDYLLSPRGFKRVFEGVGRRTKAAA